MAQYRTPMKNERSRQSSPTLVNKHGDDLAFQPIVQKIPESIAPNILESRWKNSRRQTFKEGGNDLHTTEKETSALTSPVPLVW